ncbi:MAG: hypothetical protein QXU32_01640 [Nitrososphaerales archaeon]
MFTKYANASILEVKSLPERPLVASLDRFASFNDYQTDDGYLYVRVRAISSRVNKNHDGWPSEELKKSYHTFLHKPIFIDHHNTDPMKARGVVVDAKLHVEDDLEKVSKLDPYYATAPKNHLPPTWIELLLEVDAKRFPKLAKAIIDGDIDGVSMGANVEHSICSHCENVAYSPEDYCNHIISKGALFDMWENGVKVAKPSYEDCYGVKFFEISFVFDPADETAKLIDHKVAHKDSSRKQQVMLDVYTETYGYRTALAKIATRTPQTDLISAPEQIDTLGQEQICPVCGSEIIDGACEVCNYQTPPKGFDNPDLEKAKEIDDLREDKYVEDAMRSDRTPRYLPQEELEREEEEEALNRYTTSKATPTSIKNDKKSLQETPILPASRELTDQPINKQTLKDYKMAIESNRRRRLKRVAEYDTSPDKTVDVEQSGGVMTVSPAKQENVEKNTGDFTGPATDTWQDGEGNQLGQADPVTTDSGDFFTVSYVAKKNGIEVFTRKRSVSKIARRMRMRRMLARRIRDRMAARRMNLQAPLREEVGDRTRTDSNEQFRKLKRTQPVTKERSGNDVGGPIGEAVARAKRTVFLAMKLAEREIQLGITKREDKFNRIAELENENIEVLEAQLQALQKVRLPASKTANAAKVPSLKPTTAAFNISAHSVTDDEITNVVAW